MEDTTAQLAVTETPAPVTAPAYNTQVWKDMQKEKRNAKLREKRAMINKAKEERHLVTTKRLDAFLDEFLKNGGNATQAAITVFGYKSKTTAASTGHMLLKQGKELLKIYMEEKGASYGQLIDNMITKNKESKTPEWSDRLMRLAGYEDFMSKQNTSSSVAVSIVSAQKDLAGQYVIEGEEVEDGEAA